MVRGDGADAGCVTGGETTGSFKIKPVRVAFETVGATTATVLLKAAETAVERLEAVADGPRSSSAMGSVDGAWTWADNGGSVVVLSDATRMCCGRRNAAAAL